ncbi:unnamed protein product [Clavelina lepadiformis]|uniref:NACHT domain-containing protein n=1 Tax=Clavelina lepadiformis TaxID=159417 RepID=A0ABP0FR25_CLALP
MKEHNSRLEKEGDLQFQGVSAKTEIPPVHPAISEIIFYAKDKAPADEEYDPDDNKELYSNKIITQVQFQDLLKLKSKFISIIGRAGSGKTVLSKKLTKAFSSSHRVCIHIKFMDMNNKQPLTLRELFLDNMIPGQDEKVYENIFNWLKKNDEKLILVLDGFDQAEYTLDKNCPKIKYDKCVPEKQLIHNLFIKQLFPNSLLVVTSRPHAVLYLPEPARPQVTYALGDLSLEDTKKLFLAFADEDLWRKINATSSQMLSMCRNPLMLQMIISTNTDPSEDIGDASTPTRLFATVMKNLTYSHNFQFSETMDELARKLQVLAFAATKHGKVVLTAKELRDEGVDPTTIHDIMVQLHCHRRPINSRLFEGNTKFYFCHQTFQEHLTASYVVYGMPVEKFQEFLETSLFQEHWTVVRRFVCGLLFDLESKAVSGDLQIKKKILKKHLIQQLAIISEKLMKQHEKRMKDSQLFAFQDDEALTDKLLDLYACVGEGKDSSIATKAAEHFPTTIKLQQPMNSNLVPGLCFVMKHVTKQLDWLSMFSCLLDANSFHEIASVIKEMKPGQIGEMEIYYNNLQPSNIDDVIGLLRVVRDELWMGDCFIGDDGKRRAANQDERSKIQSALNKLQTRLVVHVDFDTRLRSQKRIGMNETNSKKC